MLAGVASIYLGCRHYKISFWQFTDIMAPFMILGQAIGRWGISLIRKHTVMKWTRRQCLGRCGLTALIAILRFCMNPAGTCWCFFVLLWLARQAWVRRGEIALGYLMLYSMGRVVVEGFRTDSLMLGPLRMAQVMSLVLFVGALLVLLYRRKTGKAELRTGKE